MCATCVSRIAGARYAARCPTCFSNLPPSLQAACIAAVALEREARAQETELVVALLGAPGGGAASSPALPPPR